MLNIGKILLGELQEELDEIKDSIRLESRVVLTVAKPYCSPARHIITSTLEKYGVKVFDIKEKTLMVSLTDFARRMKIEKKTFENLQYGGAAVLFLPMATHAKVTVKREQAEWAEYLMLRTGKLYVPGKYYNPKNEEWASKHGDRMPPAWKDGKEPWIEKSCSDGMKIWQQVKERSKGNGK